MSGASGDGALAVVQGMAAALSPDARAELARVLQLQLGQAPALSEQRVADYGALAAMLDEQAARQGLAAPRGRGPAPATAAGGEEPATEAGRWVLARFPVIDRATYDARRPAGAMSSRRIVERFGGSWRRACRAVWGLRQDGRYGGHGQPWQSGVKGAPRVRYSDDECLDAVRACAQHFNRVPTTSLYIRWTRLQKARARQTGAAAPRLPDYNSLHKRLGGWPEILAKAAPLFALAAPAAATAPAAVSGGDEPLLAGPVFLDGARLRVVREDRGIVDAALRKAARRPLSTWRALVAGRVPAEPEVVAALARTLGVRPDEITVSAP